MNYEQALTFLLEARRYMPRRLDAALMLADTYYGLERLEDAAHV